MTQLPDSKEHGYQALQRGVHMARELEDDWGEAFAHIFLG